MSKILNQATVLVLNKNWQAIHVRTPADAFCQMASGAATALVFEADDHIYPVAWADWLTLPIREQDASVGTARGLVRVPTVIVSVNFGRVPRKRAKFSGRSIRERDGNRCQYTGAPLRPGEGSVDHIVPRSRGGADSWENCVWTSKRVNKLKGDRLPHEAGLKLLSTPRAPKELPATDCIRNAHEIPDWNFFLR